MTPDGRYAYITNNGAASVSVIDTTTNAVVNTIPVGSGPLGMSITPDGGSAYVTLTGDNTVTVISMATNTLVNTIAVGTTPLTLGDFVGPNRIIGTLLVASEAQLTSLGFLQFVNFRGGTLQTTASLNDARSISLLGAGGTIDTDGFDSTFSGPFIGTGTLTKTGVGTLTLSGTNTYTGGTVISGACSVWPTM